MVGTVKQIIPWLLTQDKETIFDIEEHKDKRSDRANRLLWDCLDKIAKSMTPPQKKWDVYLIMLKRYGVFTYICVKPNAVEAMQRQFRESEIIGHVDINGQDSVQLLCYFGTSTYTTKEFAVLLEGIFSEMEEMNLETPPQRDLREALEEYERNYNKRHEINHK